MDPDEYQMATRFERGLMLSNSREVTKEITKTAETLAEQFTLLTFQQLNKKLNRGGLCISVDVLPLYDMESQEE